MSQHYYCWKAIIAIMIKHIDVAKYQEGQSNLFLKMALFKATSVYQQYIQCFHLEMISAGWSNVYLDY